ncbi:MAG: phosphatase PAP2 family protein, partial [Acidimicrobiia bacterium]|nr:phosphatase PAP2 family protein [Acidimicrobiia bacterium]
ADPRFTLGSVTRTARTGRRRRPSGEAPPLPRPLNMSGRVYLVATAVVLGLWAGTALIEPAYVAVTRLDVAVLDQLQDLRTDGLVDLAERVAGIGDNAVVRLLRWGTVLALLGLRRFRHLAVFLFVSLLISSVVSVSAVLIGRPRPIGIEQIGDWSGFAHPSEPVAALGLSLMGILYTLVPAGAPRNRAKWLAGIPVTLLVVARLYLGVDHPSDVIVSLVVGMAVPVVAFRLLTPSEVWPVTYGSRGRSAHLDVTGPRGTAIVSALDQQLGLEVTSLEPFALEGSSGSTPLRIGGLNESGEEEVLFAKLYARGHLRADQWYKLGRAIRYGRLEDESTFSSVRRLVEYEDYLLRVCRDAGLPTARPLGIVEITPEQEYLVVTEFFDDAEELGRAEVDAAVIDDALGVVRRMWDAGLAHRDIKPANVLVQDGRIRLIDVAFATVRPSPWRQAVDLANMMLTLALRSTPERVYERALLVFTPEEVAEAFAATRSVTLPAQLRAFLRADGRDLVARFCELAPRRPPIAIQHWSVRRVGLLLSVVGLALVVLTLGLAGLGAAGLQ